jgi:hypothetical protein
MKHTADAPAKQARESEVSEHVGTLIGWYTSTGGRRYVRLVATDDYGLCVVDGAADGSVLVEPLLEDIEEARAVAADYLARAAEQGKPQTRHPWPPVGEGSQS